MTSVDCYIPQFESELNNIFRYWAHEGRDLSTGLFYGSIDFHGRKNPNANKGIIMYTRQLWAFSAVALFFESEEYACVADECYAFLQAHFYDKQYGGYIWETDAIGNALNTKKQTYAQAFALYALTEYYKLRKLPEVYGYANMQFECIMEKCFDPKTGGYLEGFTQDWAFDRNNRLSAKDSFADKSMNTNLHILEAFTSFYETFRTLHSFDTLKRVVLDFAQYIIGADHHLILFMDEAWHAESSIYSFGHDIETSWLLWEAAEVLGDNVLREHIKVIVLNMVDAFLAEGIDKEGAVLNEKNIATGHIDANHYWWPQCEAMEGFANAYGMTGEQKYIDALAQAWQYTSEKFIDSKNGEWHTCINPEGVPVESEDKGGMWKTPYHNGRALMRLIKRFK